MLLFRHHNTLQGGMGQTSCTNLSISTTLCSIDSCVQCSLSYIKYGFKSGMENRSFAFASISHSTNSIQIQFWLRLQIIFKIKQYQIQTTQNGLTVIMFLYCYLQKATLFTHLYSQLYYKIILSWNDFLVIEIR